jgi:hypothetical protein
MGLTTGFGFPAGTGLFLFATLSRQALDTPTFSPAGTGGSFLGLKRLEREADQSPPSCTEIKNAWSYTSLRHTPVWHGASLNRRHVFGT